MSLSLKKGWMMGGFLLVLLSACTLNTSSTPTSTPVATATPNIIIVTPQVNLPAVGFPDLTANGVTPCVVKNGGSADVMLYTQPGDASAVAVVQSGAGLPAFQYANGWYQVNYTVGAQQLTGWVAEAAITIDGDCVEALHTPSGCSVKPTVGRVIDVYGQPDRSSQIVSALGDRYSAPFQGFGTDGWFKIDIGNGQSGWIAPDEGALVGSCDNGS